MMARMPAARWLGEHSPKRAMQRYDIVCLHTIVGNAPAHAAHFSTHHDGRIEQSRDTRWQSGANLDGNPRVIAIENEDHGPGFKPWNINDGHAVPAFTDAQIEACAQILAWAHQTHGIPLQLAPNSRSTSRGLAYHRQGIDGNFGDYAFPGRVAGGEVWTESRGKVCPGDRRIAAREKILTRAKLIVVGVPAPEPEPPAEEEDSMYAITKFGTSGRRLLADQVYSISDGTYRVLQEGGVPVKQLSNDAITALQLIINKGELDDDEAIAGLDAKLTQLLAEEPPPVP